jgi:NADH:ubiquinone oxidoreductase subunit K
MFAAIDVPKSKSISVAFMGVKAALMGLLLCFSFGEAAAWEECSDGVAQSALVFRLFFLIGLLLDAFLLSYFLCTLYFARTEFLVLLTFHLLLAAASAAVAVAHFLATAYDCDLRAAFLGACLVLTALFVAAAFLVMYVNLLFALKFANFGCNFAWAAFWLLSSQQCGSFFVAVIGFVHLLLSVVGLIAFAVTNALRKNIVTANFWKYGFVVSIVAMALCFVVSLIAAGASRGCGPASLFILTYQKFGAVEVVSPVLLLAFLNTEMGDPRTHIMKDGARVFVGGREN